MNFYQGKKVVITGGSSGIGKATALLLAKYGAHVCLIARDQKKIDAALAELRSSAATSEQKFLGISCSVADRTQLIAAAQSVLAQFGGIDLLINSAGVTHPAYIDKIPDQVWDSMIQVDYMGTVNAIRAFLPRFMQQKHGNIVNISSVLGYMGVFGYAAYGAAKFAVVGLSECLRQDLLPYNIEISVVYPPDTDTPQLHEENKIKPPETRAVSGNIKVMPAEKIALALLQGASRGSFSIVPGGMNKLTWFLNRHLPSLVFAIVTGDLKKYWNKQGKSNK